MGTRAGDGVTTVAPSNYREPVDGTQQRQRVTNPYCSVPWQPHRVTIGAPHDEPQRHREDVTGNQQQTLTDVRRWGFSV